VKDGGFGKENGNEKKKITLEND
jgi:hypothetical protein